MMRSEDRALGSKSMQSVLDALNTWFASDTARVGDKLALWDVLCALRGPDVPELGSKAETTAIIRLAALPAVRQALPSVEVAASFRPIVLPPYEASHFLSHVRWAAQAMGLEVGEEGKTS